MNNQRTTSPLLNRPRCYAKSHTAHAGRVLANTRPHQLCWGDRETGTAISCTECSQVAGLIQKLVETPRKRHLLVQLSFVQRSCVAIVATCYQCQYQCQYYRSVPLIRPPLFSAKVPAQGSLTRYNAPR